MRVGVYPADEGGCGHYRLIWPVEALRAQGHEIALHYGDAPFVCTWEGAGIGGWKGGHPPLGERLHDVADPGYDVVVIQRPLRWWWPEVIPHLQRHGVRVVVEVDDDFDTIPLRNAAWADCHPVRSPERNGRHLAAACRLADLVTVSTDALAARYGAHGRVRVLRNCIPERYLNIEPEPHFGLYVGWSGTVANHPDDLQVTGGAIGRALDGASFAVVGDGRYVQRHLDLREPPVASGWLPIDEYPAAVAQLDIGIVPLADHAFNRAKSWLKGLEMAALGVPFVASPTPEYQRLHEYGAGLLARKARQWEGTVRALLRDEQMRVDLAAKGRDVAADWTIEGNAWRWAEAWTDTNIGRRAA